MNRVLMLLALLTVAALPPARAPAQSYRVLHDFMGGADDGAYPHYEGPVVGSSQLFGITAGGGALNRGVIFRLNTDGSGYTNLHVFTGWPDGDGAAGGLTLDGTNLYGMTQSGGANGGGIVFTLHTDGSGYTILRDLTSATDGSGAMGSLLVVSSNLYGLAAGGGTYSGGTLFTLQTNGSGFRVLHHFNGATTNGLAPYGHVILCGTNLYGLTYNGGDADCGVLFRIGTNGGDYAVLHHFGGGADAGVHPAGSLALDGATLYGTTSRSGGGMGTLFRINTDGTGHTNLHTFGVDSSGWYPLGTPTVVSGLLYGTTSYGGQTLFQMDTNGAGYATLHLFTGAATSDGMTACGSVALDNRTLYGWTAEGGAYRAGTVFAYSFPAVAGADSVGDGIADTWRQQYFGGEGTTTNGASCAGADPDGDGRDNRQEYGAGTNPTNAASLLRIVGVAAAGPDAAITWQTAGGRTNVLQASDRPDLPFTNISPNVAISGTGDVVTNLVDAAVKTDHPARFYRVQVVP